MSRFAEAGRFAVRGVLGNKMRSALTTLGILIGVAAVIILVSVGTGSSAAVSEQISSLGSNTLTVSSSQGGGGGRGGGGGGGFPGMGGGGGGTVDTGTQTRLAELTVDDAGSLLDDELAPDVKAVAPTVAASSVTATYTGASHDVSTFTGTTPSYLAINDWTVAQGSVFSDADYTSRERVALVGSTVAQELAGGDGSDLLDQTVQFNGVEYSVVGILTSKGTSGNQDQDDVVIAPLTAVQDTLTGYGSVDSITVQATSADTVDAAQAEIEDILNSRHRTTSADADFSVSNASSFLEAATSTTDTLTVLLGAVAAISLLVGGIGVMNIMLVTVTERTREIGIRKAIGAQRFDIVSQFLIEAVLLSVFGGLMGVLIGVVGSQFTIVGVEPVIEPYSVVLAFGVSVLIGLFFGLYPANRAASLRPIDALRYE
ncbi:peptide ABC transporter permease [Kineosporia sp. NBRC 101677]|uniref:ABC transporter permease n=1 Tax=Kineosporia sp. NBRC 101677 TaxID=3032197 RepID=UPI0024A159CC|nr:ABC transporter permease [Kineosporia sp. NBRC 101677]GLY13583.1 peptide ABC transporter permease [Kineosporia sp. NBRC 101677]